MKIKNILLVLVLALLSFGIVGCTNNEEAENLAKKIYIVNHSEIKGSFPLPKYVEGNKEAPITWESNSELVVIGEYPVWDDAFDSELYVKATVTLELEEANVLLTATVKFGKQTAKKELPLTLVANEYEIVTAAGAKQLAKDDKLEVQGTVVMAGDSGYIVKDETGYIYAYLANHGLKVGHKVLVRGLRDTYNYMPQIKTPVAEKLGMEAEGFDPYANLETKTLAEVMATPKTNVDFFCSMFKVSGLIGRTSDSGNPYSFTNPVNLLEYVTVTRYSDADALEELSKNVGEYVDAIVMVYSYRDDAYNLLYVTDSLEEKTITYTEQDYVNIALQQLQLKYAGMLVTGDLDLEAGSGLEDHKATVVWESLNKEVIADNGKVAIPDENIDVTLKITATIGEKTATGTVVVSVKKLSVSTIASLYPLTPAKQTDDKPLVLIEGVVVGYQYQGYWVADETGAMLIYTKVNNTEANITAGTVPVIGKVIQVKGELTTFGEAFSFTTQITPIGTFTVVEKAAPTVPDAVEMTFDEIFALTVTTREEAKALAKDYYGKKIIVTGDLYQMGTDNFWKVQNPNNPGQWFRLNNLQSNTAVLPLKNNANPKNVTVTVIIRDIYFLNDTSTYDNYRAGAFGGVFLVDADVVVND